MKKAFIGMLEILLFFLPLVACVCFPKMFILLTAAAVNRYCTVMVPTLFFFFCVTQMLSRLRLAGKAGRRLSRILTPVFGVSESLCGSFLLGLTAGFPNGAIACARVYQDGKCTEKEAAYAVALSNAPSAAFLCGYVGAGLWNSPKAGLLFLSVNAATVWITSVFLRFLKLDGGKRTSVESSGVSEARIPAAICDSLAGAATLTVKTGGFIVFFTVMGEICALFAQNAALGAGVCGFFELSNGLMRASVLPFPRGLLFGAVILGFSGISVILQVMSVCLESGIPVRPFIISRLIGLVVAPAVMTAALWLLPFDLIPVSSPTVEVFAYGGSGYAGGVSTLYAAFSLLAACFPAGLRKIVTSRRKQTKKVLEK